MQKILPHLWFDKEAVEAAEFYTTVFPKSRVLHKSRLRDTPSGDCDLVNFELGQQEFMAISAGPLFKFNPSVSFIVNFDPLLFGESHEGEKQARQALDAAWESLSEDGKILMPLDSYPFSQRYGWIQDKYGLSWQLMLTDPEGEPRPFILPALLFTGDNYGKAEEAFNFYQSVFRNAQPGALHRYPAGMAPDKEGMVMFSDFQLEDAWFALMESAREHGYGFNESVSFMLNCADQQEIDYYWGKLSAVPEAEQCGWLKDQYGLSWQITWAKMESFMRTASQEETDRVMQAVLKMKKLDTEQIQAAM